MHPNYQRFAQMNGILNVISQSRYYVLGALTHESDYNKHIDILCDRLFAISQKLIQQCKEFEILRRHKSANTYGIHKLL